MRVATGHVRTRPAKAILRCAVSLAAVAAAVTGVASSVVLGSSPANATGTCPTVASDGTVSPAPTPGVDWDGCDFTNGGTVAANLTGADLAGSNLAGSDLAGADLQSSLLTNADLADANLDGASLNPQATGDQGAALTGSDLGGAAFANANLSVVTSGGITGSPVSLPASFALLDGYLVGFLADLEGADFSGDELSGTDFQTTDLTGADFANADLANADFHGATLTNASLTNATLVSADLDANLTDADLSGADANGATLVGNLSGAILGTTDLQGARVITTSSFPASLPPHWIDVSGGFAIGPGGDLSGDSLINVSLEGADLENVDFMSTNFFNDNLADVDLTGADLIGAAVGGIVQTMHGPLNGPVDLSGANLTDTQLNGTQLGDAELTGVTSSGIVGTPASLPVHWGLYEGALRTASVLCSKVTGRTSRTVTFGSCAPASPANATASFAGSSLASGGTLTWSTSGQTTVVALTSSSVGRGLCKRPTKELDASGPVTGGTSTYAGAEDWVSMQLCTTKSGKVRLAKGTQAGL